MVKRMKKVKTNAQASVGVLTRAKAMGLKKSSSFNKVGAKGCYLQLRSRRVERRRAPLRKKPKKNKKGGYGDVHQNESTIGSLADGSDAIKTPTSGNKVADNVRSIKRVHNARRMLISQDGDPRMLGAQKLDDFFAIQEKKNIERFTKKYNFDPVNEKPLKGRYEWVKFKP